LKKILLISDTHGFLDDKLWKYIDTCDEVWHAGDLGEGEWIEAIRHKKPFKAVFGNIDSATCRSQFPEELIFNCEGVKVMMLHIGGYPEKLTARLKQRIKEVSPTVFICGHSHILKVQHDRALNVLFMNPGACGSHGFHVMKTALRFEVNGNQLTNLEVIELGKRSSLS
jgi:uncharacterized protein